MGEERRLPRGPWMEELERRVEPLVPGLDPGGRDEAIERVEAALGRIGEGSGTEQRRADLLVFLALLLLGKFISDRGFALVFGGEERFHDLERLSGRIEESLERALDLLWSERGLSDPRLLPAAEVLARFYLAAECRAAEPWLRALLAGWERSGDPRAGEARGRVLLELADLVERRGADEGAAGLREEADRDGPAPRYCGKTFISFGGGTFFEGVADIHRRILEVAREDRTIEAAEMLDKTAGEMLATRGPAPEVLELVEESLRLKRELLPAGDPRIGETLCMAGVIRLHLEDHRGARDCFAETLRIAEQYLPDSLEDFLVLVEHVAKMEERLGNFRDTSVLYDRARERVERYAMERGEQAREARARLAFRAGWSLYHAGDLVEAGRRISAALALAEEHGAVPPADVENFRTCLAVVRLKEGKIEEAERLAREAHGRLLQAGVDDVLATTQPRQVLATIRLLRGDARGALADLRQCLERIRADLGWSAPYAAVLHRRVADAWRALGNADRAESHYLRALSIFEDELPPAHPEVAAAITNLAALYRATDRPADAAALEQMVRDARGQEEGDGLD